jgi:hypothetical protein
MGLLARLFSTPERQFEIATECFRAGKNARAAKAADLAIDMCQRRAGTTAGDATKRLLDEAWFLRGQLYLKAADNAQALRCFNKCLDCVARDAACLAFVVNETVKRSEVPQQLYPLLIDYVANDQLRRSTPAFRQNAARIRKLLRPDPDKPGSVEATERWNMALRAKAGDCAWAHYHLAIIAATRRDWKGSYGHLQRSIALDRRNEAAVNLYTFAVLQLSGPAQALAILKKAAESSSSRGTLLLRAYLESRAGDLSIAAQSFRKADTHRALQGTQLLAFAETLVRLGQMEDARKVLDRLRGNPTPTRLIIQALAAPQNKPDNKFLQPLSALVADAKLRDQVVGATMALVATDPGQPGALAALQRIPATHRDDRYRLLEGACFAAQRRWSDAIGDWSAVLGRNGETAGTGNLKATQASRRQALVRATDTALLNETIDRYLRGDFVAVVQAHALRRLPGELGVAADRVRIFALSRLLPQASNGKLDEATLNCLSTATNSTTPSGDGVEATVLLGAILAAAGRYQQALDLVCDIDRGDAAAIGATAALRLDKAQTAIELLDRCTSRVPRGKRLRAIAIAQLGHWDEALAALEDDPANVHLCAAIRFLAGRHDDIQAMESAGSVTSYYKAVCFLRAGHRQAGEEELAQVEPETPLHDDAEHLLGWLALGDAGRALREDNIAAARAALVLAAQHWRGQDGAGALLSDAALLALLVQADDRSKLKDALTKASRTAGFADPKSCHQLAVFHLTQGHICVRNRESAAALAEWEAAVGCIAVVLASRSYMDAWRQARTRAYDFVLPPDADVPAAVMDMCKALFENAAGQMEAKTAEVARSLSLLLDAELHAAGLLAQRGGFEIAGQRRVFGPTALAGTEFASEFAECCFDIAEAEGRRDDNAAISRAAPSGFQQLDDVDEIEHYFSSLRLPALLLSKGEVEQALNMIERASSICHPLCTLDRCASGPRNGCSGRAKRFVVCNPAFARDRGTDDLKHAALNMQLSLLLRAAEREIVKQDLSSERLKQLWRRAADVAKICECSDAVRERTNKLVFGRLKALGGVDQIQIAYELVSVANEIFASDDLQSEIARLKTNLAIDLANKTDDYVAAVDMLRQAYQLNPHQPRVKKNFITALTTLADRSFKATNKQSCFALLREAHDIATQWRELDAFNNEVQDIVYQIEIQYAIFLRTSAENVIEQDRSQAAKYLQEAAELTLRWSTLPKATRQTRELAQAVAGELAIVIAGTAIQTLNSRVSNPFGSTTVEDFVVLRAVNLLRAASKLNSTSAPVTRNLMFVLYDQALQAIDRPGGLNASADLMNEARLIGETWLKSGNDKEIRDLVDKISGDLKTLNQARPDLARTSKWREPSMLRSLISPAMEDGIAMLRREKLL